jgi:hypothetical protein
MSEPLTSFWILPHDAVESRGFGVTAFSVDDAFRLLREAGCDIPDRDSVDIAPSVQPTDLDPKHITPNCGPAVLRGVWYPFARVGP